MSLAISTIITIVLTIISINSLNRHKGISILSIFLFSYVFYQMFPVILFNFDAYPYTTSALNEKILLEAVGLSLLALIFFFIGFSIPYKFKVEFKVKDLSSASKDIGYYFGIFGILVILIFTYIPINTNLIRNAQSVGIFLLIGSSQLMLYDLLTSNYRNNFKKIIIVSLVTVLSLIFLFQTGNRRTVLGFILIMVQIYLILKKKKISTIFVIVALPIFFLSTIAIRAYRTAILLNEHVFSSFLFFVKDGFINIRSFSSAIDSPTCFFFFGKILENVPEEINFTFGLSYSRVIFFFIPRSFWPNKPLKLTQVLADTFWPKMSGTSVGATLVGESYYNFGVVGLILVFFIWGIVVKNLQLKLVRINSSSKLNLIDIFLIAFFTAWIPDIFRGGGFSSSLSGQIVTFGFPLIVLIFLSLLRKTKI